MRAVALDPIHAMQWMAARNRQPLDRANTSPSPQRPCHHDGVWPQGLSEGAPRHRVVEALAVESCWGRRGALLWKESGGAGTVQRIGSSFANSYVLFASVHSPTAVAHIYILEFTSYWATSVAAAVSD
eukprot:334455-Prymnesium_polylepis.1